MRAGTALALYFVFVFVGAALIAPWVSFALQSMADAPLDPPLKTVVNTPFRRVVNRCLLVLALIGIWPLIKALGFRSWQEIGIREDRPIPRDIGAGLLIGTILLALAAASSLVAGASQWDTSIQVSAQQITGSMVTAIVVACIEGILFRGAIFTALRRTLNDAGAVWCSSSIYALLHFFAQPQDPAQIQWHSGFEILARMLRGFTEFETVIPGFLNLTLLGVIFTLAFKHSGALWMPIGIHAALIFWAKMFITATNPVPTANLWLWGTAKLVDGWFYFLLLSLVAFWFAYRRK
jgi:uncharacterized protein